MLPVSPLPNLTHDTIYGGAIRLRQPKTGYRFGTDAMLLAACVPLKDGDSVLELGCGVGAVLHALAWRAGQNRQQIALTGIEREPAIAQLARDNAADNDFSINVQTGDITDKTLLALGAFDHVVCNPPFHPAGRSTRADDAYRAAAHLEETDGLAAWLAVANRFLKPKGRLTMIHRADRLHDYLPHCARFLGDITLIPFWPKAGMPAKRLVLTGRKGSRAALTLHPGVVLHTDDGASTPQAEAIICHGQKLKLTS